MSEIKTLNAKIEDLRIQRATLPCDESGAAIDQIKRDELTQQIENLMSESGLIHGV